MKNFPRKTETNYSSIYITLTFCKLGDLCFFYYNLNPFQGVVWCHHVRKII